MSHAKQMNQGRKRYVRLSKEVTTLSRARPRLQAVPGVVPSQPLKPRPVYRRALPTAQGRTMHIWVMASRAARTTSKLASAAALSKPGKDIATPCATHVQRCESCTQGLICFCFASSTQTVQCPGPFYCLSMCQHDGQYASASPTHLRVRGTSRHSACVSGSSNPARQRLTTL